MLQGKSNILKANQKRECNSQPEWRRYDERADQIQSQHPAWSTRRIARKIFDTLDPPPKGKGRIKDDSVIKRIERRIRRHTRLSVSSS
jgi:hypothetical protein